MRGLIYVVLRQAGLALTDISKVIEINPLSVKVYHVRSLVFSNIKFMILKNCRNKSVSCRCF